MLDKAWRSGVDFAAGMTAYYAQREAHHRKLADAAHRDWQELHSLAESIGAWRMKPRRSS